MDQPSRHPHPHDRTASDRTLHAAHDSGEGAILDDNNNAAAAAAAVQEARIGSSTSTSDVAGTPTPTATLFLGRQHPSTQEPSTTTSNVPPPPPPSSGGATRQQSNISAVPMGIPGISSNSHASTTSHIQPQHASIIPPLASPAFAQAHQAALGRGRAPTLHSHPSAAPSASNSPAAPSRTATGLPMNPTRLTNTSNSTTASSGPGSGHRSMPSTSASLAFSDAPPLSATFPGGGGGGGAGGGGGGGNMTETESLLSGGEDEIYGQSMRGGFARKGRPPALQHHQTGTSASRPARPPGSLRPSSAVGSKGKGRTRSRSNMRRSDDEDDSSEPDNASSKHTRSIAAAAAAVGRGQDGDPVSVLPAGHHRSAAANVGIDDDEVERRDRGEELVRRRMRERKKEKKDAERRERKRREEETRRDQERQTARALKTAGANRESFTSESQPGTSYQERPPMSRRSTGGPDQGQNQQQQAPAAMSRSNTMSRDISNTMEPGNPYSPTGSHLGSGGYWPPPHTSSSTTTARYSATPTPHSPFFPPGVQHQQRSVSYATSQGYLSEREREGDIFSEDADGNQIDTIRSGGPSTGIGPGGAWRDDASRSGQGEDRDLDNARPGPGEDDPHEEEYDEDMDEDDSNEDVEYTLKDRQDAINIEHPFGLPIWKPALYKKDRSVHRNADKEIHLAPSFSAERHLLPGNIFWALLFGWWMALVSLIFACLMCLVPFGGVKYGRVIWELGGYLFWPFGKYVERYEEGPEDDLKGYDELSDDGEDTVYDDPRVRDVEDAGKTWSRQSGRSVSSSGTIKRTRGRSELPSRFQGNSEADAEGAATSPAAQVGPSPSSSNERTQLLPTTQAQSYGTTQASSTLPQLTSSSSETEVAESSPKQLGSPSAGDQSMQRQFRIRASGRLSYWFVFYLIVAPMMFIVCVLCWFFIFTIPMAKLLWILLRDMGREPLALHFRAPSPYYVGNNSEPNNGANGTGIPHLEAGQRAPRHSRRTYDKSRAMGRLLGSKSTIILCTYKAMGFKYYKYTIDGINIIFINLLPMIVFVIFDFSVLLPFVEKNHIGGFLGFLAAPGTLFTLALLSVIPLSYFIGMGVASISAQSSIGMGAVINATFGSVIEIILYSIALSQGKGQLVEGSIVGSLLAGVLLMPGLSMIGGAVRRKEQRFNARSAGVTSTMLIMAIIGILTPTLFYEIYGTFQLTCTACPPTGHHAEDFTCRRCFYEHVDPVDDEFYKTRVQALSWYCAVLLVFSYLIGLWFSLRTHASQIWQNQQHTQPTPHSASAAVNQLAHTAGLPTSRMELPYRASMYKKMPQLLPTQRHSTSGLHTGDVSFAGSGKGSLPRDGSRAPAKSSDPRPASAGQPENIHSIAGFTAEEVNRAFHVVAATASALQSQQQQQQYNPQQPSRTPTGLPQSTSAQQNLTLDHMSTPTPALRRQGSQMHDREISKAEAADDGGGGHGGHDAPNWSRFKSYSVLFACTVLYAAIAEILVDVVDVVLEGSGLPEKFLGISLFALVPNVTEFMNAISFALNGNIALSMEIGSAYALQVCLLQIPAMVAFTYFYGRGKESMIHRAFTLIFPRWDAIAIMFSVFLLTYTYIEARSNYYRGSILVISYLVLLGGFYMAPAGMDNADDPLFMAATESLDVQGYIQHLVFIVQTAWNTLFSH